MLNSSRLHCAALRGMGKSEAAAAGGECPLDTWVWGIFPTAHPSLWDVCRSSCWNPVLLSFPGRWCCWVQAGSDSLNASGKELVPFPLLLPTHTQDCVLLIHQKHVTLLNWNLFAMIPAPFGSSLMRDWFEAAFMLAFVQFVVRK